MTEYDQGKAAPQAPRRVERRSELNTGAVFLADCSYSMDRRDGTSWPEHDPTKPRRIDRLAQVLGYLLGRTRLQALICFADFPEVVALQGKVALPEPNGGTALHLAFELAGEQVPTPVRVIVLTDGWPNDRRLALEAGRKLRPCVIDAFYVGAEGDTSALEFMRELAECGGPGGKWGKFDLADPLRIATEISALIAGPRA